MKRVLVGYADLLWAWERGGPQAMQTVAGLLGLREQTESGINSPRNIHTESSAGFESTVGLAASTHKPSLQSTPFWRVIQVDALTDDIASPPPPPDVELQPAEKPQSRPSVERLMQPAHFARQFRQQATQLRASRALAIDRVVERICRAERLVSLPRVCKRTWGNFVQVICDRSDRLAPYWADQIQVIEDLATWFPKQRIEYGRVIEGFQQPTLEQPDGRLTPYRLPPPGSLVLVLSDLGCLDQGSAQDTRQWLTLARRIRHAGCRAVALVPGDVATYRLTVGQYWDLMSWSENRTDAPTQEQLEAHTDQLVQLCAHCTRLEPGLLRALRHLIGADAAVEALVWQHPLLSSPNVCAAPTRQLVRERLRAAWPDDSGDEDSLWRKALRLQCAWRNGYSEELWAAEVLHMPRAIQALPEIKAYMLRALAFIQQMEVSTAQGKHQSGMTAWLNWYMPISSDHAEIQAAVTRLYERFCDPETVPVPAGYQPGYSDKPVASSVIALTIYQLGSTLQLLTSGSLQPMHASLVGQIQTRNGQIKIGPEDSLSRNHFWKSKQPPDWANDWGVDKYGQWVEFVVQNSKNQSTVTQRMRWIKPGTFVMGSPEDEPGRVDDEGPQHAVTLTQGYWLFDTPVTQALYEAVMGDNPSHFKCAQRPVEQVSWQDAKQFIQQLNQQVSGLDLSLPSEAQWEYACRAETTEATYAGAMNILGENNAPILDKIAWYGGNSGVDFDLNDGYDSSGWKEKQHDHTLTGTRVVAQKQANAWGVYDMLGNVWEWCEDGQHEYTKEPEINPLGSQEDGAFRVLRGGSWNDSARFVRCAFRLAFPPESAHYGTGFRCARVHEPGTGQQAEPAEPQQGRVAEQRTAAARTSAARLLDCRDSNEPQTMGWPQMQRFVIHSDREKLYVEQFGKPPWAYAIGRDAYGLWVSFKVASENAAPVMQKMRWIPPGRFWMGSPEDEPGRITQEELEEEREGYDLKSEGPAHIVEITHGYWLFDTPVTQALYEAVMGDNPSEYKSARRPVEQVSWHDAQTFIQRLNEKLSGLKLSLPSEAQWEYACRAGIAEATYAGAIEILGQCNAPVLDAIAWYSGNSGHKFDLDEGYDSSEWPEKQYEHTQTGTRIVAQKKANDWGLFDMLGNVWEWGQDGLRIYSEGEAIDPVGSIEDGAYRVLRGGSWYSHARDVRCAARIAYPPEHAADDTGFRCARVHELASERRGRPATRVAQQRGVDDTDRGD